MRKLALALCTLLAMSAAAQQPVNTAHLRPPKEIQIGTFAFLGTTDPNCGDFCGTGYLVTLDASALTGDVLSFGDIVVCVGTICQHGGPWTTPVQLGFFPAGQGGILPDCVKVPCRSIDLQLVSTTGEPFSLVLLDGTTFRTFAVNTTTLKALPGQHILQPQSQTAVTLALDRKGKK